MTKHQQLAELEKEHEELKRRLERLKRRAYLTPSEQLEATKLKKQKLQRKDAMRVLRSN